ncbi:DUF1800 domain-containing protein [Cumulibacter manganitolerans]|uniref:DUF1800 domain-containing protein n=1 Tax=Cumulibacter manganitolerans TaxID=1884992 RepID=UPI0012967249|nr:DUF1800 domain-containing protein [Cumulibacter manganitolerans]
MRFQSAEWIATARLVRRTGFGAGGSAVDAAVAEGAEAYLARVLAMDPAADAGSKATPMPKAGTGPGSTPEQRAAETRTMSRWWLRRMAAATTPLAERLTMVWHNHFATSLRGVVYPGLMLRQNESLRSLGRGDFRNLALAMLTDGAMLRWLNGVQSTAKAPNENLSREFMELFSLGHDGGYTEQDVKEGARALTGWRVRDDGSTYVEPKARDTTTKTVLGVTGNLDAAGFCDAVLAQPAVGRFLARRMWTQLAASTPPSEAAVGRISAAYGPQRNLHALFAALLADPDVAAASGALICGPVEWLVGVLRALKVPTADDKLCDAYLSYLRVLGQLPFDPPSVGGWPTGVAWLSTAATEQRIKAAQLMASHGDLSTVTAASGKDRVAAACYLLGIGELSDRTYDAVSPLTAQPAQLVTALACSSENLVI